MKIDRFEEIIAWQKAKEMTIEVYRQFEASKDFGFRDKIQRAAISVMNNIAEGFKRRRIKSSSSICILQKGHVARSVLC